MMRKARRSHAAPPLSRERRGHGDLRRGTSGLHRLVTCPRPPERRLPHQWAVNVADLFPRPAVCDVDRDAGVGAHWSG